jgi:levoglucosan dehydrogenase
MTIKVGVIGTSWWADAMYLPALKGHPQTEVTAVCGRDAERTQKFAARWELPYTYTDPNKLIESGDVQALVISTANDSHYPITMRAIDAGLHVLCEKPLGLNYGEAKRMADSAEAKGIKHLVPFTYSYMPTARYIKELIEGGYIGQPYHLNLRYYAGYGRDGQYMWRFDMGKAGAGAVGDIGSHFMYIARWTFGEITGVFCRLGTFTNRPLLDPKGKPYEQGDDTAIITLQFENGAQGVIHVTTMGYEDTPFGQTHHMEFHGSGGTLYSFTDWDKIQRVSGAKVGEGMVKELPIPEHIWNGVRHDTVHNTYKDIFRTQDFMARQWLTGIVQDKPLRPNFHDGAVIQRVIDASLKSNREQRWVEVKEIV